MQRTIVWFVVGLLGAIFGVLLAMWIVHPNRNLDGFAATILAPALGLSGPVLGFYFKSRDSDG